MPTILITPSASPNVLISQVAGSTIVLTSQTTSSIGTLLNPFIVAYWNMNESSGQNRADSVGTSSMKDISGSVGVTSGIIGNAASFTDRLGQARLTGSNGGFFNVASSDFAFSFWFKVYATAIDNQAFISKYDFNTNKRQYISYWNVATNTVDFVASPDGTFASAKTASSAPLSFNNTYFCVVQKSGTSLNVSINGGTPTSSTAFSTVFSSDTPFMIGGDTITDGAFGDFLSGSIDEVAFYNKALSNQEIAYVYNSGSGHAYPYT